MREILFGAAGLVLLTVAVGLFRVLAGPTAADRMMALQLLGTGGIAGLLLVAAAGMPGALTLALVVAVLAAFVPMVFAAGPENSEDPGPHDP
jgi:multicomponent Na+:H+ antiporter subunit F